jgi:NADH:ubiquinone oxidoreductase subunit 2 (subunit N)
MYLALIIFPLLGSISSGFFGRKIGVKGSHLLTCTFILITTILSIMSFFEVGFNNIAVEIKLFRWIDSESFNILWGFNFDSLTVSMLIPILIISLLVHIYSIGYMSHDPHNQRFFSYLSLFTFMMIVLVTADNILVMFIGWEGVGVCSYLLVSFWFTRIAANQSSISAFLTNRVGDSFLTVGMFIIIWSIGNLDYGTIFSIVPYINESIITLIGICLLIGAMAKSSQIGLHVWLPMAMEGPTPVSALIHAATMVTAGVYLLMRASPLIEYSSTTLILCLWVGAMTSIFSSLIGLFQQDIKKVIAYSTMSQLAREYNICIMFRHQTICVGVIFVIINSQITKAHKYYYNIYISNNFFNSFIKLIWQFIFNITEKWKIIVVSKLVGISEAIRLILFYILYISFNIMKFNKFNYSTIANLNKVDIGFNEWLAGLIDGDGHFILSKSGSARLYIVMDIRDKGALYEILHKFGGSIRPIAGAKALRYNLSNKKGLLKLIEAVNGNIRNPTRLLQLNKLCNKYNVTLKYPKPLTFNNGWFSGFVDSDGSIYYNELSGQVFISATQKNIYLLEPLINIYGGRIDPSNARGEVFKYIIYRKKEIFNMIDNYFNVYPLRTLKFNRLKLIKKFYEVKIYNKSDNVLKLNEWITFKDKWEKYKY